MGILKALARANDWHADRLHNGGRVMAHSSSGASGGLPSTHCPGCGKQATETFDLGGKKGKSVGYCGKAKCSKAVAAKFKSKR